MASRPGPAAVRGNSASPSRTRRCPPLAAHSPAARRSSAARTGPAVPPARAHERRPTISRRPLIGTSAPVSSCQVGFLLAGVRHGRPAGRRVPGARVGRVGRQFGVDLGGPGLPGGGPPAPQHRPAQVGVERQARHPLAAGQQPAEQAQLIWRRRGPAQQLHPGQLLVAARLGGASAAARPRPASCRRPAGTQPGSASWASALLTASSSICSAATDGSVAMLRRPPSPTNWGTASSACRTMSISAAPAHGSGERIGQRADRGHQRGQRALVEPDQRVAEVVVVDQHQIRLRLPDQRGHRVRAPATSTSTRWARRSTPSVRSYSPIAMWCGRSVG